MTSPASGQVPTHPPAGVQGLRRNECGGCVCSVLRRGVGRDGNKDLYVLNIESQIPLFYPFFILDTSVLRKAFV